MSMNRVVFWAILLVIAYLVYKYLLKGKMGGSG